MVSILRRRHFVPNPVVMHSTGFRAKRRGPLSIHTWYDAFGDQVTQSLPNPATGAADGPKTTSAYDLDGNLVSTTDPLGHVTSYAYDSFGNELSQSLPDPATRRRTGQPDDQVQL